MKRTKQNKTIRECKHCKGNIDIRNPKGFCDHLYYPEYCETCKRLGEKDFAVSNKKQVKQKKTIRERKCKDIYTGEASPYREYLDERGDMRQEHELSEPIEANPDGLAEHEGLFYQGNIDDARMDFIKSIWHTLTHKQQQVLQLVGYEGRSLDNCAVRMKLKKSTIQTILQQAQIKIKKAIRKQGLST